MLLLNKILGRFAPGYMSFGDWCDEYDRIILTRNVSSKTLANRRNNINHLVNHLHSMKMKRIKPVHVASVVKDIWSTGAMFTARRVLIEAVDIFNEAVLAGVIDTNPAIHVKQLPAKIKRSRMTLEQWEAMRSVAAASPPWIGCMLQLALITGQRRADLQKMGPADIWDGHLHIIQQKTGTRLALPLDLRLDCVSLSLNCVVDECMYGMPGPTFLRKSNGSPLSLGYMSTAFNRVFQSACGRWEAPGTAPSLHECRSLSERLYRAQGVDTKTLLGHRRQSMTDQYNDDRGLHRGEWTRLIL